MKEIVHKILLAGYKFCLKMHLKQPGFTYNACGLFTKNKERIRKFKETGDTSCIYKNELDKACCQHDMAYGDLKDLARKTSDKVLIDKAFNIAKITKYDGCQRGITCIVYKFFDKKSKGIGVNIPLEFNEQLAKESHKRIIRNFKKRTVYYGCKDNIWGTDLDDMQLIRVVPLKDKKGCFFFLQQ